MRGHQRAGVVDPSVRRDLILTINEFARAGAD
jgi:hypothetical protein